MILLPPTSLSFGERSLPVFFSSSTILLPSFSLHPFCVLLSWLMSIFFESNSSTWSSAMSISSLVQTSCVLPSTDSLALLMCMPPPTPISFSALECADCASFVLLTSFSCALSRERIDLSPSTNSSTELQISRCFSLQFLVSLALFSPESFISSSDILFVPFSLCAATRILIALPSTESILTMPSGCFSACFFLSWQSIFCFFARHFSQNQSPWGTWFRSTHEG
mmetsp:Transcript_5775/g.8501  ORF Transcript_5775/g.8501 Transcript_5775/m.8501 type:complete len:224 (-) Transcript_5775:202-873(-)